MQLNYIYTIAIILTILLILALLISRSFIRLSFESIKKNPINFIILPLLLLCIITSIACSLYVNAFESFDQSFKKILPSQDSLIYIPQVTSSNIDLSSPYTIDDFTKYKQATNLNASNIIHIVTGTAQINTTQGNINAVRVVGIYGNHKNSLFGKDLKEDVQVINPINNNKIDLPLVFNSDYIQTENIDLIHYLGPDFTNKATLLTDDVTARKLFDIEASKFNATLVKSLNNQFSTNSNFYGFNLHERYQIIYGDLPSLTLFMIIFIIPLVYLFIKFISYLKNFYINGSKEYGINKIYGINNDLNTLIVFAKLLPSILISVISGGVIGFIISIFFDVLLRPIYSLNRNLMIDQSLLHLGASNFLNSISLSISISTIIIIFTIYFVFMYFFTRNARKIYEGDISFPYKIMYWVLFKRIVPYIFILLGVFTIFSGLSDQSFSNMLDENAFKTILTFIGLNIILIAIYKVILKRVNIPSFRRYYFGTIVTLILLANLFPFLQNTLKLWPFSYLIILLFIYIHLSILINKRFFQILSAIIILIIVTAITQLNLHKSLSNINTATKSNTQIQFIDPIGHIDYDSLINQTVSTKDVFKNSNTYVSLAEFKQKDFTDAVFTSNEPEQSYVSSMVGITPIDYDLSHFTYKDKLPRLKTNDDVKNELFLNPKAIIIGGYFNSLIGKTYAPQLKVGDTIKIELLNPLSQVIEKQVIAILDDGALNTSLISNYQLIKEELGLRKAQTTYSLNLLDSSKILEVRTILQKYELKDYEDVSNGGLIIENQFNVYLTLILYELGTTLILILVFYIYEIKRKIL